MIVRGRLLLPHLGDLDLTRSRRHVAARLYTPGARSRGVASASGAAASRFRPQEEAAGRDDTLAGLEPREHLDRIADDRTELHRTFRETGVVALHRHVDDTAVTDRLHRVARHERHALARSCLEGKVDVHAKAELHAPVRHFDAHLARPRHWIDAWIDIRHAPVPHR